MHLSTSLPQLGWIGGSETKYIEVSVYMKNKKIKCYLMVGVGGSDTNDFVVTICMTLWQYAIDNIQYTWH